jgi:hypothetical protein
MSCVLAGIAPDLRAQTWTPAGQMIGPLMWEFPLTLPDGTHLIPMRWVNKRDIDSVYWFDIKSFTSTPKMYERQTPEFNSVRFVADFDTDGVSDVFGHRKTGSPIYLFSALTTEEHLRPAVSGQYGIKSGVTNRYFGDVDGDGLNDDYIAESATSARIVYGDKQNPFMGPSYVSLFDNSREIYPDLPPTKVIAVGMLGGKPCIVQSYQLLPDTPPYYELHELDMDDLRARTSKIKTRLLQKLNVGTNRFFGNVVLRTRDVWWLFSAYGSDSSPNGIRISSASMTLEPVSEFWRGESQQYYGQGGRRGDENIPRVMDGDRPFIMEEYMTRHIDSVGDVRHAVFTLARLAHPLTAEVEIVGRAVPPDSQLIDSYAGYLAVVPDIDGDSIHDMMINAAFKNAIQDSERFVVSLYLTSQRPVVSVKESVPIPEMRVIDQDECWRIIDGMNCLDGASTTARIYDINGVAVATVTIKFNGTDAVIDKPQDLSRQTLWLRMGKCSVRLQ